MLRDSALGLAAGASSGGVTFLVANALAPANSDGVMEVVIDFGVGTLVGAITAGVLAGGHPVRLRTPEGQNVAGLAVSVSF